MTAPKHTFTYTDDPHEYRIDGRKVPSVTEVVGDILPGYKADNWYLQVGSTVHACLAKVALGQPFDLDLSNQEPEDKTMIEGKIVAGRKFLDTCTGGLLHIEKHMWSVRNQSAGTCDLVMSPGLGEKPYLVDYKGTLTKAIPYQLGGYSQLLLEQGENVRYGIGVELRGDGTYKTSEVYDLLRRRADFLVLLRAFNIRREVGVTE